MTGEQDKRPAGGACPGDCARCPLESACRWMRRALGFLATHRSAIVSDTRFAPAAFFAVAMVLFSSARFVLYVYYPSEFAPLGLGEVLFAFLKGALFDAAVFLVFAGLPLVLMTLPLGFAASRWYRGVLGWPVCALLLVFVFALAADTVYFQEVHRHAGPETWAAGNDIRILVDFALEEAPVPLFEFVVIAGAVTYLWYRLLRIRAERPRASWRGGALSFGLLLLVVLTVRGGVTSKPLSIADAFEGVSVECGNLILNGPYSLVQSLHNSYYVEVNRVPQNEAEAQTRRSLASDRDRFVDDEYPLLRMRTVEPTRRPNVVVILLESWSAAHVDCIRRIDGREVRGATPVFDGLASRGMLFTRFYSSGQRSISGIAAILTGLPTLPGMPFLGVGMELNELCYMGRIAKRYGYSTYFLQGSPRMSFKCDAISSIAGFDDYFGEEDIPASDHADHAHAMGAWDYDLLMKADEVFAAAPKPFCGFVFTLSTHRPNDVPNDEFRRYDTTTKLGMFLNSLSYSDWALGRFFEKAREHGYYDDTVFVLTADHTFFRTEAEGDVTHQFRVPLVIVAPGVEPELRDIPSTHADILPTVMDLAGWSALHSSCGRSLMERTREGERFAVCTHGRMVIRIEKEGWVLHDMTSRRAASKGTSREELDAIERRLYSFFQTLMGAMRRNRVYHDSSGAAAAGR